ncbi:hypothetical protein Goshw_029058, partial [Gossypium schwendimanii]|nr:hypothetical protein [Gossypium schwendimanii]
MRLGISMCFSILEIVVDSITIVKKCQTIDFNRSVIGALVRDIHSKKIHFQEIEFHFIPKAENTYAHILAKEALKKGEGHYLLGGAPGYVRCALQKRRPRLPDWKNERRPSWKSGSKRLKDFLKPAIIKSWD